MPEHEVHSAWRQWNVRRLLQAVIAVAVVVVAGFGIARYNNHASIRQDASRLLRTSYVKAQPVAKPTKSPKSSSNSTPLPVSSAQVPLSSATLPLGEVVAAPPPLAAAASTTPLPSGTAPSSGSSSGTPAPSSVSVAVLTPLLSVFQFGSSVGFLLVCNTGSGTLSAAAAQVPGLSQVLSPVIGQISPLCSQMSTAAVNGLNMVNQQLAVLQGLNPASQAYFNELNQIFATLNQVAPDLQPLTGALTALGPLVDFFSGQSQG